MSDPRKVILDSSESVQQRNTEVTSPRSPVKLEDYANIRRPPKQQQQPPDRIQGADTNKANNDGKSSFQHELESALRERKKRGLVTGLSDSESSTIDGAEIDNNNVVNPGNLTKADPEDHSSQWHTNNDSIPFNNSDLSLNQSNEAFDRSDPVCSHRSADPSLSQRSSLFEFEQLETVMNHHSQSSTGLGEVSEENTEENVATTRSGRFSIQDDHGLHWPGPDSEGGDILQLDDTEGSGLMNENELRDQGVLFEASSGSGYDDEEKEEGGGVQDDNINERLPEMDSSNQMLKMYMEPSPQPPGYPEDDYEEDDDVLGCEEEDYINSLKKVSVDDVANGIASSDISNEEDDSPLEYSNEFEDDPHHLNGSDISGHFENGDLQGLSNGHPSEFGNQEYDVDGDRQSRTPARSDHQSEDNSETASPELGNTVIRNDSVSAAILAAASKVESFVDEPGGGESDATSVSLGQFVPNAVPRTRLPPPGQRRSSLKERQKLVANKQGSTVKKLSPRTIPRRSKPNSPRSVHSNASRRDSVRSNSQSEVSARDSLTEEYLAALNHSDHSDMHTELPTLMSMYLNNDGRFKPHQRPDGVPPLDFGNSINSNISFIPRDDDRARSQAEEFAEQLQMDYDDLLAKYAQAENTIDQLRLGAKVNLYGDDPLPGQAMHGSFSQAKQPGVIQFGQPQKAAVERVLTINTHTHSNGGGNHSQLAMAPGSVLSTVREDGNQGNTPKPSEDADDLAFPLEASAGGKAMVLMFQAKDLQEQVDAFETLLKQNQLTPPEQKTTYDNLKAAQDKLESDYMQAKEEDNAMRRRNSIFNNGEEDAFDPERAVEGQIFQMGMRLDDIHETVMENLRNQPVEIPNTPSVQEMFPPTGEQQQMDHLEHQTGAENQVQSKIPVLENNSMNNSATGVDVGGLGTKEEEEEEEESPSPPFSPSGSSTPDRASPYNGDFDDNNNQQYNGNNHHKHYQQHSLTSSSPDFAHVEPKQSKKDQHRRSIPRNHTHPPSPRTGSSDQLDNGGAGQKSPVPADFDSGFMGSESSRQSNQMRPFGYKRTGLDGGRTKARENKQASQIPQVQKIQRGQRAASHHGSTVASSRESPLHSEGVASDSEEETMIQMPARKQHGRTSNAGRPSSIPKATSESQEPCVHPKHTQQKLKHSPPHQTTPPSSKKHQRRHSQQSLTPSQARAKHGQVQEQAAGHVLQEPHQQIPNGGTRLQNGYHNGRVRDEHIPQKPMPSNATKSHLIRPSSSTIRTKKYPHRTAPSAMYESGSEISRSGSEVTRSSAKSEAVRALQDQIDELRRQLPVKNQPQVQHRYQTEPFSVGSRTPAREEASSHRINGRTPVRQELDYGRPSGRRTSTAGSTKSEALQALRQELEDVKGQLRQKQNTPRSDYRSNPDLGTHSAKQSTPLRDSLRETLRSQYIPQDSPLPDMYSRSSLPLRNHSTPFRSPYRTELPPKLHVSDLDASPPRTGPSYHNAGAPYVASRTEPCPLCGGSGSHTHNQYHGASPPQPASAQYPPQPSVHFYPQSPPHHSFSYAPMTTSTPAMQPMTTSTPAMQPMPNHSYAAGPSVTPVVQQSQLQSTPLNGTQHHVFTTATQTQPAVHIREDPTPAVVYVTPAKRKGRYYSREESPSSSTDDDDVELYYRRTPSSSSFRTPRSSRTGVSILRKSLHREVSFEKDGHDRSLDSAASMARRLKRSSHRMLSSVKKDMNRSASLRETGFY